MNVKVNSRRPLPMVTHQASVREWMLVVGVMLLGLLVMTVAGYQRFFGNQALAGGYTEVASGRELEVTFLDVGQGDSVFIRTPSGKLILIDAGPGKGEYSRFDAGERVVVPFLKRQNIKRIDTLIMTHPHADHYGGMFAVLKEIEVGEFLDPGLAYPSELYEDLLELIDKKNIPYRLTHAPATLDWDPSILVQVLWPEKDFVESANPNNVSITLRIVHGDIVYLLTGDIEAEIETHLYAYQKGLRTTILKVPHHGSDTSSTQRFLEYVRPRLAVFPLGINNKFGFPEQKITERYRNLEIQMHRTDLAGTLRTFSDGKRVKAQPDKNAPFTIYPFPAEPPEVTP